MRLSPFLAAPLTALLALAGCESGGGACGLLVFSENEDCDACMQNKCCHALAACDIDTPCGRLTKCVLACPERDTACTDACLNAEPEGALGMQALFSCYQGSCEATAACETRVCGTGIVISNADCGACLSTKCCDTWKPCTADTACTACLTEDPKPQGCSENAAYLAASACFIDTCGGACAATICDSNLGTEKAACNVCLGRPDAMGGCCETTKACKDDIDCYGCMTGKDPADCSANAYFQQFNACIDANCAASCGE